MISFDLFEAFVEIQGDTTELAAGGADSNQIRYELKEPISNLKRKRKRWNVASKVKYSDEITAEKRFCHNFTGFYGGLSSP
ncbi:hypothetical protein Tco_1409210 [Tanacetum coccineum]